jgi:hypothetical protein
LFLLAAHAAALVFNYNSTVYETNDACPLEDNGPNLQIYDDGDYPSFGLTYSYFLITLFPPDHGTLAFCLTSCVDVDSPAEYRIDTELDFLRPILRYTSATDYANRRTNPVTGAVVKTANCGHLACLDLVRVFVKQFYEGAFFTTLSYSFMVQRHIAVMDRVSLLQLSTTNVDYVSSLQDLSDAISVVDPDRNTYNTTFYLMTDGADLFVTEGFNITGECFGYMCTFTCLPRDLFDTVSKLSLVSNSSEYFTRVKLGFISKTVHLQTEACADFGAVARYSAVHATIMLRPFAAVLPYSEFHPTFSVSARLFPGSRGLPLLVTSSDVLYVAFNTYLFSTVLLFPDCFVNYFDSYLVEYSLTTPFDACTPPHNYTVDVCQGETQSNPRVADQLVTGVSLTHRQAVFDLLVFDANDQTWGLDDGEYSFYAFHTAEGFLMENAGIVFGETRFNGSELRDLTCTEVLNASVVYAETRFCYVITSDNATDYQYTAFIALDAQWGQSDVGFITFEASFAMAVCEANSTTGPEADCTAMGKESNDLYGDSELIVLLDLASSVPVFGPLLVTVTQFPAHGSLYHCLDPGVCKQRGELVVSGQRTPAVFDLSPLFIYVGHPDYFNFIMYENWLGGLFPSYSDLKGVPFGECDDAEEAGCPDFFLFSVQYSDEPSLSSRVNLYVQNIGSRTWITLPFTGVDYTPFVPIGLDGNTLEVCIRVKGSRVCSPYSGPRGIQYHDVDGDVWLAELWFSCDLAQLGSPFAFSDVDFIPLQAECYEDGYCAGTFVLRGFPSDLLLALEEVYFKYYAYEGDNTTAPVGVSVIKTYRYSELYSPFTIPIFPTDFPPTNEFEELLFNLSSAIQPPLAGSSELSNQSLTLYVYGQDNQIDYHVTPYYANFRLVIPYPDPLELFLLLLELIFTILLELFVIIITPATGGAASLIAVGLAAQISRLTTRITVTTARQSTTKGGTFSHYLNAQHLLINIRAAPGAVARQSVNIAKRLDNLRFGINSVARAARRIPLSKLSKAANRFARGAATSTLSAIRRLRLKPQTKVKVNPIGNAKSFVKPPLGSRGLSGIKSMGMGVRNSLRDVQRIVETVFTRVIPGAIKGTVTKLRSIATKLKAKFKESRTRAKRKREERKAQKAKRKKDEENNRIRRRQKREQKKKFRKQRRQRDLLKKKKLAKGARTKRINENRDQDKPKSRIGFLKKLIGVALRSAFLACVRLMSLSIFGLRILLGLIGTLFHITFWICVQIVEEGDREDD